MRRPDPASNRKNKAAAPRPPATKPARPPSIQVVPFVALRGQRRTPAGRASPAQPSPGLPAAARAPLRPRDGNQHHVAVLKPPTPTTTKPPPVARARMPTGDARPRQPPLGAAARPPLMPKIAAPASPAPLPRRPPQGRADCAGSAPAAPADRPPAGCDSAARPGLAVAGPANGGSRPARDSPADSPDSNKFFYASNAKPARHAALQRPASVLQRPASVLHKPVAFFYANGTSADARREPAATKFFYANGAPDLTPSRPPLSASASASTLSTSSRLPTARPGTSCSAAGFAAPTPQRPASPVKAASTPLLSAGLVPLTSPKPLPPLSTPPPPPPSAAGKRRVSIDAAPRVVSGHARSGSVPSAELLPPSNIATSPSASLPSSPPLSPGPSQPAMTMACLIQAAEELGERDDGSAYPQPEASSPTKPPPPADPVSELVANARRERKVQDLEITNASLEAINRTLERQLRKQTAELRRYRRLSRSGRISLPSAASSRVPSSTLTDPPLDLSDLSEEEASQDGGDREEEYSDSLDDSELSGSESVGADKSSPNSKLAARRKRDERRLRLDLTKHQELLIDSQRLNQSLKRCLDWTEVLIKEGQKALAYNVRVSDVEFGGRVLAPPDDDDSASAAGGAAATDGAPLEPPSIDASRHLDSGIELPVDGG